MEELFFCKFPKVSYNLIFRNNTFFMASFELNIAGLRIRMRIQVLCRKKKVSILDPVFIPKVDFGYVFFGKVGSGCG